MNYGKEIDPKELRKHRMPQNKQVLINIAVSYPDSKTVLTVPYYTPPIGWVYDYFEKSWVYTGVYRRSNKKEEQYWEIDKRFKEYKKWKRLEDEEKKGNKNYKHPQLQKFIQDCWRSRLSGFWFMNNGEETYITGAYWYLISVFEINIGTPPDYNEEQRNLFYHWELVEDDDDCHGLLVITQRRGLKTYSGACIGIEKATRRKNFRMGIQSKTEDDAKKVYTEHVFYPFRKEPYFFIPEKINLPKGDAAPVSGLRFNSGSFIDDVDENDDEGDELMSEIIYKNSRASAFDGYRVDYYYVDEDAKSEVDPYKRWMTVRKSLENKDRKITGKSLQTTTIEEITPESLTFMRKWGDSNQFEKTGKRTATGLHKHFIPAHKMQNANIYGKVDSDKNIEIIKERRESQKNSPHEYAIAIRQDPLNEIEAFTLDADECRYNPILLGDRITELTFMPPQYEVGNLAWKNGQRFGQVEFLPNPNGRCMVAEKPNRENCFINQNGFYIPDNKQSYCAGSDTYDHKLLSTATGNKFSLGSMVVLKKENAMNPTEMDNAPVFFYLFRPEDPEIFYEDTLMACWWYGCQNNIETQKPALINYYLKHNCQMFMPKHKNGTYGTPASTQNNFYIASITESYINSHINKVKFVELVDQWKKFKPEDTQEFDAAMAFGYALQFMLEGKMQYVAPNKPQEISEVLSLMRRKSLNNRKYT